MSGSSDGVFLPTFFDRIVGRRLIAVSIWLAIAVAGIYLFIFEPGQSGYFPPCPFRALTGLNCPSCGTTRCLHQLLHGNVSAGFKLNPLFVVALPFLIWALLAYTNSAIAGGPPRPANVKPRYVWSLVGLIISFWIFRNTPFYPFPS